MVEDDFSPEDRRLSELLRELHAPESPSRPEYYPQTIRGGRTRRVWPSWLATALVTLAVAGGIVGGYFGLRVNRPTSQPSTTTWRIVQAPSGVILNSIACLAQNDCWGVGSAIEHYDGTSWSAMGSPVQEGTLLGVACVDERVCWAVGDVGGANSSQPLIEEYTGGSWYAITDPLSTGTPGAFAKLSAVTCSGPSDCWAVGMHGQEGGAPAQPLVERYDGAVWSITPTPDITSSGGELNAIACPESSTCWAVGDSGDTPLIEHYLGGFWTVASASTTPTAGVLRAVSCLGVSDCWAVGSSGSGDTLQPLIEHLTNIWTVAANPQITALGGGELAGVACPTSTSCWAVGDLPGAPALLGGGASSGPSSYTSPLVEQYSDGSWITSSDVVLRRSGTLTDIGCDAPGDCVAVGSIALQSP